MKKTVRNLLDENFIYARALHYLGIDFFHCEEATLEELCVDKGIDHKRLIRSLYQFDTKSRIPFGEINEYPLPLVVAYLKFAHQGYIKNSLPFIVGLLKNLNTNQSPLHDLIAIFPLFVEDFIKHIYREEDHLFGYIDHLYKTKNGGYREAHQLFFKSEPSLAEQRAHHQEEDEMASLRELIEEVQMDSLHVKIIVQEIKAFDREMLYHAAIENEILFPKAIGLESEVLLRIQELSALN